MGIQTELHDSNRTLPRVPKTNTIYQKQKKQKQNKIQKQNKNHIKIQYYMSVHNNKKESGNPKIQGEYINLYFAMQVHEPARMSFQPSSKSLLASLVLIKAFLATYVNL